MRTIQKGREGYGQKLQRNSRAGESALSRKAVRQGYEARERRLRQALQQAMQLTPAWVSLAGVDVRAASQPAWEAPVGGDFCDVFPLGCGDVVVVVGDVCGHGLSAARHVPEIKFALRAFLSHDSSPGYALARLNDWLCLDRGWSDAPTAPFATATIIVLNGLTGLGRCSRAGSDAPLLLRPLTRPESVGVEGMALGVIAGQAFEDQIFQMVIGDFLFLTTDGVTEARQSGEMLGQAGAVKLATDAWNASHPSAVCSAVLEGARRFAGGMLGDDASVVTISRCAADRIGFEEPALRHGPGVRCQKRIRAERGLS